MISFHENWHGITKNMLMNKCLKCNPSMRLTQLFWWEDGTPIGHKKSLPNKYQHKSRRAINESF